MKVEEMWSNRIAKVESRYDHRRKKGLPCECLEVEKHIEAEMIRCFELELFYSRERKTKKWRWLNILSWPSTILVKAERRRISSLTILYLHLCVYLTCSSTLSFTLQFRTFRNKRKRKEADYILLERSCLFIPARQHKQLNLFKSCYLLFVWTL